MSNEQQRNVCHGYIDVIAGRRVSGWAFARELVYVEASIGDRVVASVTPDLDRPDVAMEYPAWPNAARSGFVLDLPETAIPATGIVRVKLTARPIATSDPVVTLAEYAVTGSEAMNTVSQDLPSVIVGPFPRPVIALVAALWPEACADLASSSGQRCFLGKLRDIMSTQDLRLQPAIADYARYVRATWTHCNFVNDFFPTVNPTARRNSADFHCKPNAVREIFAIVHQLYVLKSYGINGDFAEFGCFKGFSSAMLSFACQQLGTQMHIFDSFEGLPPSEGSGYAAGDYAGSLEEVTDNVTRFGSITSVQYHKGFFSDTFRTYRPPQLMCLWMDVDLEVSARDLMVVADRLDPRATLFSHECTSGIFRDGEIVTTPGPDNPIPPMLGRFEALGRPLTGCFVQGNTGAFWPRDGGVPVLENSVLLELARVFG
jgi:hypothetical protein